MQKQYSEISMLAQITNFTRNSLKKSFFPRDFEGAKSLSNYEKPFSGNYSRKNLLSEGIVFCPQIEISLYACRIVVRLAVVASMPCIALSFCGV